jgi:hypothetical protein
MGEYDGLIADAENGRDEATAEALQRLEQLEAVLLAGSISTLWIQHHAGGHWEARLGRKCGKGHRRVDALLALAEELGLP